MSTPAIKKSWERIMKNRGGQSFRKKIPIMRVGRYAGTPVDQLPLHYMRWMITQDFPKDVMEIVHRKLKASDYNNEPINISRHALDMFSKRFLNRWTAHHGLFIPEDYPGIATFVATKAAEAWEKGENRSRHRYKGDGIERAYEGIIWVFGLNDRYSEFKELITLKEDTRG